MLLTIALQFRWTEVEAFLAKMRQLIFCGKIQLWENAEQLKEEMPTYNDFAAAPMNLRLTSLSP